MAIPALFEDILPFLLSRKVGAMQCHFLEAEQERCSYSIRPEALEEAKGLLLYQFALLLSENRLKALLRLLYCRQSHASADTLHSFQSHLSSWKAEVEEFRNNAMRRSLGSKASNTAVTNVNRGFPRTPDLRTRRIHSEPHVNLSQARNLNVSSLPTPPSSRSRESGLLQTTSRSVEAESPPSPSLRVARTRAVIPYNGQDQDAELIDREPPPSLGYQGLQRSQYVGYRPSGLPRQTSISEEREDEPSDSQIEMAVRQFEPQQQDTWAIAESIYDLVTKVPTQTSIKTNSPSRFKRACVYALRDLHDRHYAVKVGFSLNFERRFKELKRNCSHAKFKIICKKSIGQIKFGRRAEKLAHRLLAGRQTRPFCRCAPGLRQGSKNEYFVITDEMATKTIDMAVRFTRVAYNGQGQIHGFWKRELQNMSEPPACEEVAGRLERWKSWLDQSEKKLTYGKAGYWVLNALTDMGAPREGVEAWLRYCLDALPSTWWRVLVYCVAGFAAWIISRSTEGGFILELN